MDTDIVKDARYCTVLSPERAYRYTLWRLTGNDNDAVVVFIGLNPSTADETIDDPTIRRCVGYARDWGYGRLCMLNLFAYRATCPPVMMCAADPVGPDNDRHVKRVARHAQLIVAAWGTNGHHMGRDAAVTEMLGARQLHCLRVTKDGHPQHPLYLPKGLQPIPYLRSA